MDGREALSALQRALADVLAAGEPDAAALERAALPAELRARLGRIDAAGLRITGLLVVRLRFQRLLQGSRRAAELFDTDPAAFASTFRRYARAVPPLAHDPWGEAAAFERWLDGPGAG